MNGCLSPSAGPAEPIYLPLAACFRPCARLPGTILGLNMTQVDRKSLRSRPVLCPHQGQGRRAASLPGGQLGQDQHWDEAQNLRSIKNLSKDNILM